MLYFGNKWSELLMQRTIFIFYPNPYRSPYCVYSSLFLCSFFSIYFIISSIFSFNLFLMFSYFSISNVCCYKNFLLSILLYTEVFKSFQTARTYFEIGAKAAELELVLYKCLRHLAVFILKIIKHHALFISV